MDKKKPFITGSKNVLGDVFRAAIKFWRGDNQPETERW
jgi:hypothetical protein